MPFDPDDILSVWFEGYDPNVPLSSKHPPASHWFKADEAFDLRLKRFEPLLDDVSEGRYDAWADTPMGRVALILLCDQVPRNLYRNHRRALAWEKKALSLVFQGLDLKHDAVLDPGPRIFFYMPLMHSECLEHQRLCGRLARSFLNETKQRWPCQAAYIAQFVAEARRHCKEIEVHGRFRWRSRWKSEDESLDVDDGR